MIEIAETEDRYYIVRQIYKRVDVYILTEEELQNDIEGEYIGFFEKHQSEEISESFSSFVEAKRDPSAWVEGKEEAC